jgi:hypothetical protein
LDKKLAFDYTYEKYIFEYEIEYDLKEEKKWDLEEKKYRKSSRYLIMVCNRY